MIDKLNLALKLPLECEHPYLGKGIITRVYKAPAENDLIVQCTFTRSASGMRWSFQCKANILHFDNMYLCDRVYDALQDPRKISAVMAILEGYSSASTVEIESTTEELMTPEEVVAEMEAYYGIAEQAVSETDKVVDLDEVIETIIEVSDEAYAEEIEEAAQEDEAEVSYEEAVAEDASVTETTAAPVRRNKKKRK